MAGALAAAALVVRRPWSQPVSAPALAPLAIIPAGAAFVMDVDLARLRKTAAGAELSRLGWLRLSKATSSAAFQPLRDLDELVVAVPGSARFAAEQRTTFEPDSVAVVAVGRFSGKAAADAAVERIRARGGDPLRTRLGSFESVRDLRATGEVAARDGLFVLSDGAYLRAVLAAAEGHHVEGNPSESLRDRVHAELRRTFARGAPVTATLTLPEGSLEAALGDPDVRRSPLARVRSAALRIDVSEALELDGLVVCASADDCGEVAAFLRDVQADVARALGASAPERLLAAPVRHDRERVLFTLSLPASEVKRMLAPPAASR